MKKTILCIITLVSSMALLFLPSMIKAGEKELQYHVGAIENGVSVISDIICNEDGTVTVIVDTGNRTNVYTLKEGKELFDKIPVR